MLKNLLPFIICAFLVWAFHEIDPLTDSIKRGKEVYNTYCITCHQPDGAGLAGVFPPLANSDYLMEDKMRAIKQVLNGAEGEITVNGTTYNAPMTGFALSDQEVADVLNYVRNNWGNQGEIVRPDEVAKIKAEKNQ